MSKLFMALCLSSILLMLSKPLHAQGGCTDSPENPTVVLAAVASAGALISTGRARWKARRRMNSK